MLTDTHSHMATLSNHLEIEMATQSKKLTVLQLWETVYLQGRDNDGNLFTTLDGFHVNEWKMYASDIYTVVFLLYSQQQQQQTHMLTQ